MTKDLIVLQQSAPIVSSDRTVSGPNEALLDAARQNALLSLESCRRISHYSLASHRDLLNQGQTINAPHRWWHSGLPIIDFGSRSLHECGFFLEVSGDTYARWTDLCEEQWQRAHDCVQTAIANQAPGESGLAAERQHPSNNAPAKATECRAEAAKTAVSGTVEEIASTPSNSDEAAKKDLPTRSKKTRQRIAG